jgi:hypothetical protein
MEALNKDLFTDKEQPGVLVMTRCLEPIYKFVGSNSKDLWKDFGFTCKKFHSKIIATKIIELENTLNAMKQIPQFNLNKFQDDFLTKLVNSEKIKKVIRLLQNKNSSLPHEQVTNLLIYLMVPVRVHFEINEFNQDDVIKHYCNIYFRQSDQELTKSFAQFIMKGVNYKNFIKSDDKELELLKGACKRIITKLDEKEFLDQTVYDVLKAKIFLPNYERILESYKHHSYLNN